jgi:CheY-like chemotaxis protein
MVRCLGLLQFPQPCADIELRAMSQRILVVVGTDSERERAQQALSGAGYETDTVTNGQEGFEQLMALPYDLVVTDCTLEKLECSAMLAKVRGLGVKTPFLVWGTATNMAAVQAALRATGGDYVDQGAPLAELVKHVGAALNGGNHSSGHATPEPEVKKEPAPSGGILLIDDRDLDVQGLRALLPPAMHFQSCPSAKEGLAHAHDHKFDLVLFSADTSITNLIGIVAQLHLLLPDGFVVGVGTAVRGEDPQTVVRALGGLDFDEIVLKPFKTDNVTRLIERYCSSWDDLVVVTDDVVRASRRCSRKEQYKEFVLKLKTRLEQGVRSLIDACFDRAVVDMTQAESLSPMDFAETLRRLKNSATPFGLHVKFVVTPAMIMVLRKFETSFGWERLELFPSLEATRGEG